MAIQHHHRDLDSPVAAARAASWSLMLAGLPARLALAGGLIALLWLVVGWSLRP